MNSIGMPINSSMMKLERKCVYKKLLGFIVFIYYYYYYFYFFWLFLLVHAD
ncbi:MAG: hypothetical protein K6253_02540 [Candidatus Liberibacter asiaticus]|nr:hypothetical protein [Candidatus Liberibacter asiaticus]